MNNDSVELSEKSVAAIENIFVSYDLNLDRRSKDWLKQQIAEIARIIMQNES